MAKQHPRTRRMPDQDVNIMKLQIYETENHPANSTSWIGDESLPECIRRTVQHTDTLVFRKTLLPANGQHFLLDISLSISDRQPGISQNIGNVQVHINGYCHSNYGQMMMDKIKSHLQNDICRTSRRWRRRIIKQMEQETINQSSMDESI
jgi:hypothetical protein